MSRALLRLALPAADLDQLRTRMKALCEPLPGTYRMLDAQGRVLYVGKAKSLRTRLLGYFRAKYPEDKAARILHAASDIQWHYAPSEFAAFLSELRQIRQHRPRWNVKMNLERRTVLLKLSGGAAPRLVAGTARVAEDDRVYGPFPSLGRAREAVRVLNDLLGLRDCAAAMPIVYDGQGDLFGSARQAACHRHEMGTCLGPCAGFVDERSYRQRVDAAAAFLEGRAVAPVDRVIREMRAASGDGRFEAAARWRERFEALEWLLAAASRARCAVDGLTFVYRDPGTRGDDRAYLIRRGQVKATYPYPVSPLEREAFAAVVRDELARPEPAVGPLPTHALDEVLLVMSWFRNHPDALRRTTTLASWSTR
jgi:excinuclease ABC subunit C